MWLVIGFGNSLSTDDGFGIAVAEAVRARLESNIQNIQIIVTHQLRPEFMESIGQAVGVIFIDASTELLPGQLECRQLDPTIAHRMPGVFFGHHFSPEQLLQAAHQLYKNVPEAWLYSVGGEKFSQGDGLTKTVAAMVPQVADPVISRLRTLENVL